MDKKKSSTKLIFFLSCITVSRSESFIYNRGKLPGLIVFYSRIDIHRDLAVFMPCQILHRLWVNTFINQVGDVGVAQDMRRHIKIECVNQTFLGPAPFTELWGDCVTEPFSVNITVDFSLLCSARLNIVPHSDELRLRQRLSVRIGNHKIGV